MNIKMFYLIQNTWSIPWIEFKTKRLGTYKKINKISLSWFDDKIHILDNAYEVLALGY